MTAKVFVAGLVVLVAFGCNDQPLPTGSSDASVAPAFAGGQGVAHTVSAGSPDATIIGPPGSDGNFSLQAHEFRNGSVTGQWQDSFNGRFTQFFGSATVHIAIDCLSVDGNDAWVSGRITQANPPGSIGFLVGFPVIARVQDNGTSGDMISFSNIGNATPCTEQPDLELFPMNGGQVTVN